jgi:hypothetical protein
MTEPGPEADPSSYHILARRFAPFLERWGSVTRISHPESRLDYAVQALRRQGREPLVVHFLPPDELYPTWLAKQAAFFLWDYPDVPTTDGVDDPRENWLRPARRLQGLLAVSAFTAAALRRSGVAVPIHVVPAPILTEYLELPVWTAREQTILECSAYILPQPDALKEPYHDPWDPASLPVVSPWQRRLRRIRTMLPRSLRRRLAHLRDAFLPEKHDELPPYVVQERLPLAGIVFTALVDPADERTNWDDILTAFLFALKDCPDATLVLKLTPDAEDAEESGLSTLLERYAALNFTHRCTVAVIPDWLTDDQMVQLTRATTFHLSAAGAAGTCLGIEEFLSAGRPAVAPCHSALADHISEATAFPVCSHPEPATPRDLATPTLGHRLVWQSLHDQITAAHQVARQDAGRYALLAEGARRREQARSGADAVWPQLAAALAQLSRFPEREERAA